MYLLEIILYKRKENGAIYIWSIEYVNNEIPSIRVIHGQKNGKMAGLGLSDARFGIGSWIPNQFFIL